MNTCDDFLKKPQSCKLSCHFFTPPRDSVLFKSQQGKLRKKIKMWRDLTSHPTSCASNRTTIPKSPLK